MKYCIIYCTYMFKETLMIVILLTLSEISM